MHARTLRTVWEDCFRSGVTRPGFVNLIVVLSGWVLTRGTHAVTEALVVTDVAQRRHWEAFHRFFSRGTWDPDRLGRYVFERLARHLPEGVVRVVIDDTVTPKKGPQVFGIGSHLDAVRSTKRRKVFVFGHCWVVLAVLVRVPFSSRTWALPVLLRLHRTVKECAKPGAVHKKKTELAREMIDELMRWCPNQRIEIAVDSAYCNDTVSHDLPDRIVFFGSMRPDAVLTADPEARVPGAPGRPRVRGVVLRKPKQLAKDGRTPWKTTSAMLYGRLRTVRYKTVVAQWYRATGTRLLRIVVVECTTGAVPIRVFFTTDATLNVREILETYAERWGIEVFFRDAKQLLGFADSRARKEAAVRRVAPLVALLYSTLVLWFLEGTHNAPIAAPPTRPWYPHKRGLAFADVLRAAQRALAPLDVLDPAWNSDNLRKSTTAPRSARNRPQARAA